MAIDLPFARSFSVIITQPSTLLVLLESIDGSKDLLPLGAGQMEHLFGGGGTHCNNKERMGLA